MTAMVKVTISLLFKRLLFSCSHMDALTVSGSLRRSFDSIFSVYDFYSVYVFRSESVSTQSLFSAQYLTSAIGSNSGFTSMTLLYHASSSQVPTILYNYRPDEYKR